MKLSSMLLILLVTGCGQQQLYYNPTGCFVTKIDSGVVISCTNGTTAAVLNGSNGTNGTDGQKGDQGSQGDKGDTGNTGSQGLQGVPGNSVSIVQLCPGYTSTYPSVFPEVAFCVNNKLYAEYYSVPSSGLVYLPNGNYSSTITSAPCNFTVVSGCTIQ